MRWSELLNFAISELKNWLTLILIHYYWKLNNWNWRQVRLKNWNWRRLRLSLHWEFVRTKGAVVFVHHLFPFCGLAIETWSGCFARGRKVISYCEATFTPVIRDQAAPSFATTGILVAITCIVIALTKWTLLSFSRPDRCSTWSWLRWSRPRRRLDFA